MPEHRVVSNGAAPAPPAGGPAGMVRLRRAESEIKALVHDNAELAATARRILGVSGRWERLPMGPALRATGTGWYTVAALCLLAFADAADGGVIWLARPEVQLAVGPGTLGATPWLRPAVVGAGALATLALRGRGTADRARTPGRPAIAGVAAALAGAGLLVTAFATSAGTALLGAVVVWLASGATAAVVLPALFDALRPELRVTAVGLWAGAVGTGIGASALDLELCGGAGLTWRVALLVLAVCSVAVALSCSWFPDRQEGHWDGRRIRALVQQRLGSTHLAEAPAGDDHEPEAGVGGLTLAQQFARVTASRTARPLLVMAGAFGLFAWSLPPVLGEYLRDRWDMVAPSRGLAYAALMLAAAPAAPWLAQRAGIAFRRSPGRLLQAGAGASLTAAVAFSVAAAAPVFPVAVAALLAGFAACYLLLVVAVSGLLVLCEPSLRGHAATLLAVSALVGALVGQQLIATIGDRYGVEWALLSVAAAALSIGAQARPAAAWMDRDLDSLAGRMTERYELEARVASGHHMPLLACRHLDFSYGQVQVLFDVSLTVDDGEMVALLGTNGAGKSTLLRLVSGLSLPAAGSLHYRGEDVTFLGTDRRVALGISQIPGGKAVFGDMSVVDNLRAYGHMHGRNRSALERGIESTFEALPRLAERRNQLAATLSGGEQQMLALGKTFILRPRLLLIDELSLGLAPKIVGELLQMVRTINAAGTAVVLVEQSVNVALSLVDHAYFMEKGEMRFDGVAADLLGRPDLLRSVFLQGATKGLHPVEQA